MLLKKNTHNRRVQVPNRDHLPPCTCTHNYYTLPTPFVFIRFIPSGLFSFPLSHVRGLSAQFFSLSWNRNSNKSQSLCSPSIGYMQFVAATTPLLVMNVVFFLLLNSQIHFNLLTINHENTNLYHKEDENRKRRTFQGSEQKKKDHRWQNVLSSDISVKIKKIAQRHATVLNSFFRTHI